MLNVRRFFSNRVSSGDFDVIIADEKSCIDAGLAAKKHKKRHNSKDIPLVMFFPNPDHFFNRKYQVILKRFKDFFNNLRSLKFLLFFKRSVSDTLLEWYF